jgi:hypothetical protein
VNVLKKDYGNNNNLKTVTTGEAARRNVTTLDKEFSSSKFTVLYLYLVNVKESAINSERVELNVLESLCDTVTMTLSFLILLYLSLVSVCCTVMTHDSLCLADMRQIF